MTTKPAVQPAPDFCVPPSSCLKAARAGMWELPRRVPVEPGYVRAEDLPPGALITAKASVATVGFVKQAAQNDCYSACVATILGLDLADVPKFYPDAAAAMPPGVTRVPKVYDTIREWAWRRGLAPLIMLARVDLAYLLHHSERLNPGIPYILSGTSIFGTGHSVVACHGRIIHEPMPGFGPEDGGIVAPGEDGQYEVTYFVTLPAWASATPPGPMDIAAAAGLA